MEITAKGREYVQSEEFRQFLIGQAAWLGHQRREHTAGFILVAFAALALAGLDPAKPPEDKKVQRELYIFIAEHTETLNAIVKQCLARMDN